MKRKRIFIALGVLTAIAGVLMFLNFTNTDDTRMQLDGVFNNNAQIVALSQLAAENASVYGLKVSAASLAATTASDNLNLTAYYQERYGKEPKEVKLPKASGPVAELETTEAGAGYDAAYKERVIPLLEANLATTKTLYQQSQRQDLRNMLKAIFDNQAAGLKQLQPTP